ncbi:MAG: HD domain-containing protein [bacterium]|nr:MAG: HD domain-containing protein [bacterium]
MTADAKHVERYRGIIKFLDNAVRNIALYPADHPSVRGVVRRMADLLEAHFRSREEVLIGVINGVLYIEDYLFYEGTPFSDSILAMLTRFGVDDLIMAKGVSVEELLNLAEILKGKEEGREAFVRQVREKGIDHIGLKSFQMGRGDGDELPTKGLEAYKDAITTMRGLFGEVRTGKLPPLREAENIVEGLVDRLKTNRTVLMLLSSLKGYDAYTYQHCVNVGILALLLAEAEGFDMRAVKYAALAGMMHDIGKVKVPLEILNKPGVLTQREWAAIKAHPVYSAEVVRGMGGGEEIVRAVKGHHMHHNGAGYPVASTPAGPSDIAKLVSVVDNYDAITTIRSYKRPMTPQDALAFLQQGRGNMFDPRHVDSLVKMVGVYPPGAMVRLSSNEIGLVTDGGGQNSKPVIKMILDGDNRPFDHQWDLDLASPEAQGRMVVSLVDPAVHSLQTPVTSF